MYLICGCCGSSFDGERDSDHDKGFGLCLRCTKEEEERNEREWDQLRDKVAGALNDINRRIFLGYEKEVQRGIMLEMMDEGLITWTIRGRE